MPGLTASLFISALCFSCMLSNCDGLANYFAKNAVYNNVIAGTIQLTFHEYLPTCGWKMILRCSIEIASVTTDGATTLVNMDNFTYILGNKSANYNYRGYGGANFNVNIYTVTNPSSGVVNATWYCVCNDSTAGQCLMVSGSEVQTKLPPLDSGSIHLSEQEGQCYSGSLLEPLGKIRSLVECGSACILLPACLGVNFRSSTNHCDLVLEDTDLNPSLLGTVSGCTFWKVVWKQ